MLHLYKGKKTTMTILNNVCSVLKPEMMTLLLGFPASGKTTLLLAYAGHLNKRLKAEGLVTHNGHSMEEFIPRRTSAYIGQHDIHIGEITVRETFDFSACCQGVGSRYGIAILIIKS
ncbi:hypothetical protein SUGI_0333080 [Cryptomeria japonica]|nr:hypothetical protein SUGI_0333080 [Cryptomeria japonica]